MAVSLEAVVFGRNDDYEPNWTAKLFASFAYNRRLFEGTSVDYRVAFVEWNPPSGKELLAPRILQTFPFIRAIVVEPEVHSALCEDPNLQVMVNFSYNAALRTSEAAFNLITAGDEFFGLALAQRIIQEGLRPGCLYRAERVNVREDLDFANATAAQIESPENVISVDSSEKPPYTNASGDFLLLDAGMMLGLRGLDESIRDARLHLDSRFATNAMLAGADCEMLGRIFHINHRRSYRNSETNYPGRFYKWDVGLPYINGDDWGLANFDWEPSGRLAHVRVAQQNRRHDPMQRHADISVRERSQKVSERLAAVRRNTQPEAPPPGSAGEAAIVDLRKLESYAHLNSTVSFSETSADLETGEQPWSYAAGLPLDEKTFIAGRWYWIVLKIAVREGALGIGFSTDGSQYVGERYVMNRAVDEFTIPVPAGTRLIVFRNIATGGTRSAASVYAIRLIDQETSCAVA